jgi:phosphomannomutase
VNRQLVQQVETWIAGDPDEVDRAALSALLEADDEEELLRRFAVPLTFGTAGLRGPVMAGPAGMNRFTVRRATQGVVAWLSSLDVDLKRGVVVGRDARHGSEKFNDEVVAVLLGAGVRVLEMPKPLPTPLVPYAVKAYQAGAGIMITASHNPAADNGFKLYAIDGAQIIPPHDAAVERFAQAAGEPVLATRASAMYSQVAPEILLQYRRHFVQRFGVATGSRLPITYTPLHGVGGETMLELFESARFSAVSVVAEQFAPDGDFPTLAFPNPEEPGALDLAMATADANGSSLVIANDPDADRLGVAVLGAVGWRVLRGDEIGWLLASALLGEMTSPDDVVATSIVSSTMLKKMAQVARVRFAETLTGFKWIARARDEGILRFGYEEALGFAVDPMVADKDGMSAALALCQLAHRLSQEDKTLLDRLDEIEGRYGVHAGAQLSLRADAGAQSRIIEVLNQLRASPPRELGGIVVSEVVNLARGWHGLEPTDGVVLMLSDHGRVVVRPSGTEPKLKAYIEILGGPARGRTLGEQRHAATIQLDAVQRDLEQRLAL